MLEFVSFSEKILPEPQAPNPQNQFSIAIRGSFHCPPPSTPLWPSSPVKPLDREWQRSGEEGDRAPAANQSLS